jgi:signal transduction histidine kinase
MRRLSTVRARTTVAATVLFALALGVAAVGITVILRRTMIDNVDTALELRAADIASLLDSGRPQTIAIVNDEDSFVQIVEGGKVVASSVNMQGQRPLSDATPGTIFTPDSNPIEDEAFRVLVSEAASPAGPLTVIVGNTLESVDETVQVTVVTLAVGMTLLLVLAGATTWIVVGRALRPVEDIRAEVAEIGATGLHRRVPTPTTADEIGRLADTMNDMLDRIESGTVRQRRFVSDASHELRTPIATIRHELEVALEHQESTDWVSVAADVLDEDLRMQRLVNDLLWLARNDSDGDEERGRMTLVDLDEIAETLTRRRGLSSDVAVDVSGIGAGQVRGDADDLTRVVQNLVDNAIRHAHTRVAVSVSTDAGGRVWLHVDDDGSGVPDDLRRTIFERFTRGDEARARDDGGAGLGLAIANEIAIRHGGGLVVADSPLGGARFTLGLPDARADEIYVPR